MADYLVNGAMMVNEITFCDGKRLSGVIGGGAVYAAAGAGLWSDSVILAAGCGEDGDCFFSQWMDRYGLVRDGIRVKGKRTNHFFLRYHEDGSYEEGLLGQGETDWSQIDFMTLSPEEMEPYYKNLRGMYNIMDIDRDYWERMGRYKEIYGFPIMWEVATATADREHLEDFYRILPMVDFYSLNLKEALSLFGIQEEEKLIAHMAGLGVPVYFRVGVRGAYVIDQNRQVFAPSYITPGEVDPTGCGNASTAAAMTGLVEKRSFEEVGAMAAVAASYNARQYGPMAFMNQERRSEAEKLVNMILKNPNKNDSIKGGSDNDKYKR